MIYVMDCGCRKARDELVFTQYGLRCPDHRDARIDHKEVTCVDCGAIIELTPRAQPASRCKLCQKEHVLKQNRENRHNKKKMTAAEKMRRRKASVDAWDCIHRDECLKVETRDGKLPGYLPCYQCERYKSASEVAA